jgi:hypothetical protein
MIKCTILTQFHSPHPAPQAQWEIIDKSCYHHNHLKLRQDNIACHRRKPHVWCKCLPFRIWTLATDELKLQRPKTDIRSNCWCIIESSTSLLSPQWWKNWSAATSQKASVNVFHEDLRQRWHPLCARTCITPRDLSVSQGWNSMSLRILHSFM